MGNREVRTRFVTWLSALSLCLALGCQPSITEVDPAAPAPALEPPSEPDAVPDASVAPASAQHAEHGGLDWFVDSPEAALAEARQSGKLVLIDLWAPWCHTCLSMREYVLTAANLGALREQLVLLAVDTERAENAAVLERWAVSTWPTLYLVDGAGQVHARWVGAASPAQLTRFVRDGLHAQALSMGRAQKLPADAPLMLLSAADAASAKGDNNEAVALYRRALISAPADWPRRPESWVALAGALRKLGNQEDCMNIGLEVLGGAAGELGASASATDFVYHVRNCTEALDPKDARKKTLATLAEQKLSELCLSQSAELTPDDRSDACGLLAEQRSELNDRPGERRALGERLRILEQAARGMPDAVALTYDWARCETLIKLGRASAAVRLLEARERALPDDYNPPYYLARVYKELGGGDKGLRAVERALGLAYGPRRVGMQTLKVDMLLLKGKTAEAEQTLRAQLLEYQGLPAGQRQPAREAAVAKRLQAM
jgi:thiol-disulfide isomerase/thioredoxin